MLRAGTLNTRVTIQRSGAGQDEAGQPIELWADVASVWADFRVLSGLQVIKANAGASLVKASCRIRFRTDVTPDMRVSGRVGEWKISAVLPDVSRREYVDLVLERAV